MPFSLTCNYWQFFFLQTIAEPAISITNAAPMSIIQEEFIPSVFGDVPLEVVPLEAVPLEGACVFAALSARIAIGEKSFTSNVTILFA